MAKLAEEVELHNRELLTLSSSWLDSDKVEVSLEVFKEFLLHKIFDSQGFEELREWKECVSFGTLLKKASRAAWESLANFFSENLTVFSV